MEPLTYVTKAKKRISGDGRVNVGIEWERRKSERKMNTYRLNMVIQRSRLKIHFLFALFLRRVNRHAVQISNNGSKILF